MWKVPLTSSIFHVLTWKAGQGNSATSAAAPTLNGACTATSSCLKSVTYSTTATDTLASAWVDYQTDKAFVGSDDGKIYRISCVFTCALNTQPTVDWTFTLPVAGTGGASATPNGPVYDFPSGRLFVGDQLGEVWVINASGATATLNAGPVMIGGGGCTTAHPPGRTGTGADCTATGTAYGIPDSIIMDASGGSQRIFALSGNDGTAGASAVLAQLKMNLTAEVSVPIGLGGINLHTGAFDNGYWGITPTSGELFVCGTGPTDTTPTHYWIGFTSYPTMNSTPTGHLQRFNVTNLPCAPYTELYNPNLALGGNTNNHDLLMSGLVGAGADGYIITNDISSGSITAGLNSTNYPGGISGIIVDNVSTQNQASSMYFTTLTDLYRGNVRRHPLRRQAAPAEFAIRSGQDQSFSYCRRNGCRIPLCGLVREGGVYVRPPRFPARGSYRSPGLQPTAVPLQANQPENRFARTKDQPDCEGAQSG